MASIDGGWWHLARGGDLGQYDPCFAGKLRNGLQELRLDGHEPQSPRPMSSWNIEY
jgi:hypothetical protein